MHSGGWGGGGREAKTVVLLRSASACPANLGTRLAGLIECVCVCDGVLLLLQDRTVYAHLRAPWSDLPYRVGDSGGCGVGWGVAME